MQQRPERLSGFLRIAAFLDCFVDVRLEFFVKFAMQTLGLKKIKEPRPD
jgi:hypothetical protein